MTETTLRRMFEFDGCIDVTFERLARLVDMIDVKYVYNRENNFSYFIYVVGIIFI